MFVTWLEGARDISKGHWETSLQHTQSMLRHGLLGYSWAQAQPLDLPHSPAAKGGCCLVASKKLSEDFKQA